LIKIRQQLRDIRKTIDGIEPSWNKNFQSNRYTWLLMLCSMAEHTVIMEGAFWSGS